MGIGRGVPCSPWTALAEPAGAKYPPTGQFAGSTRLEAVVVEAYFPVVAAAGSSDSACAVVKIADMISAAVAAVSVGCRRHRAESMRISYPSCLMAY